MKNSIFYMADAIFVIILLYIIIRAFADCKSKILLKIESFGLLAIFPFIYAFSCAMENVFSLRLKSSLGNMMLTFYVFTLCGYAIIFFIGLSSIKKIFYEFKNCSNL